MQVKFNITLTPSQKKAYSMIHNSALTYLVARWSRQCGKTVLAEIMLIEYLCTPGTYNIYISPSYSQGSKVFKEVTALMGGTGLLKKANAGSLTIESTLGSTLQFFSMQSPNSIRGYTVKGLLVLDEVAFFPDVLPDGSEPWSSIIYPIIKANIKRNKVLAISTPKGKRGIFWQFHNNVLNKLPGWEEISATIYDDALISNDDIDMLKANMSPVSFEEEFMVKFLDSSITYFIGYEDCFSSFEYNDKVSQWAGIDWSGNGSDDTILTFVNELNQVKSIEIEGTLDQKYMKIASILNSYSNVKSVYAEINGLGAPMINSVKHMLVNKNILMDFNTNNTSKNEIISDIAMAIAKKEIHFNNNDTKLHSQLGTFGITYTKTGKITFMGLGGTHDDKIMSLGFALKAKNDGQVFGHYRFSF